MLARTCLSFCFVCGFFAVPAVASAAPESYHFTFDEDTEAAYRAILDLRIGDGRAMLREIRQAQPFNLVPVWFEDYADFFEVYIDEDPVGFERLERSYEARLEFLERGPPDSPYTRYARANVMLHWALARLKFGEYLTTFREARRAYKLLEENLELFPDFTLTYKELGVLRAAVATVPSGYQWGVEFVTGMEGDLEGGKRLIESLLVEQQRGGSLFLQETTAIYAFLLLNLEREEDAAWARIRDAGFDPERSLLGAFVLANIAMRTGRNDKAIALLSHRPHSPHYHEFPYLDFMLGVCLQRRLDGQASIYFNSFVERKRTGNFIKEAHQKLAWQALLDGRQSDYSYELEQVRERGADVVGSDKNALREASLDRPPLLPLLRARLLYDGGYFDRAAVQLAKIDEDTLSGEPTIEYPYRCARVAAERGEIAEAKRRYKQTISLGRDSEAYYACKAAVELGAIAEREKSDTSAAGWYHLALDLSPSEYGAGLHQQARAGLARLKG